MMQCRFFTGWMSVYYSPWIVAVWFWCVTRLMVCGASFRTNMALLAVTGVPVATTLVTCAPVFVTATDTVPILSCTWGVLWDITVRVVSGETWKLINLNVTSTMIQVTWNNTILSNSYIHNNKHHYKERVLCEFSLVYWEKKVSKLELYLISFQSKQRAGLICIVKVH